MNDKMYPCLWFDGKAKEAATLYCGIFPDSAIVSENPMVVIFKLNGTKFMGLNGGPLFQFTEATSYVVSCETQEEIDHYWNKLTADGGQEGQCGWLKDKFGFSWQIVPAMLGSLVGHPEKGQRAMQKMMGMKKLIIEDLANA